MGEGETGYHMTVCISHQSILEFFLFRKHAAKLFMMFEGLIYSICFSAWWTCKQVSVGHHSLTNEDVISGNFLCYSALTPSKCQIVVCATLILCN